MAAKQESAGPIRSKLIAQYFYITLMIFYVNKKSKNSLCLLINTGTRLLFHALLCGVVGLFVGWVKRTGLDFSFSPQ
jgi:hypothetical protein